MKNHIYRLLPVIAVASSMVVAGLANAGSLVPPGAPAPTMKSLSEVEPRTAIHNGPLPITISKPGSYYLAEPIEATAASSGIVITCDSVTIDLNGFSLKGFAASSSSDNGIDAGSQNDITIRNGEIADWNLYGIAAVGQGIEVDHVKAHDNQTGIRIGSGSVTNCTAYANFMGITVGAGTTTKADSLVKDCNCSNNTNAGIFFTQPGMIRHNNCSENHLIGIETDGNGVICEENTANNNSATAPGIGGTGIEIDGSGTLVLNNVCNNNKQYGMNISISDCKVESNLLTGNKVGLYVFGRGLVIRNTASGNTQQDYLLNSSSTSYTPIVQLVYGSQTIADPNSNLELP